MKKKLLFALVLLLMAAALPISASAELGIKPVADPWDDPNNLIKDGAVYRTDILSRGKLPSAMSTASTCSSKTTPS